MACNRLKSHADLRHVLHHDLRECQLGMGNAVFHHGRHVRLGLSQEFRQIHQIAPNFFNAPSKPTLAPGAFSKSTSYEAEVTPCGTFDGVSRGNPSST